MAFDIPTASTSINQLIDRATTDMLVSPDWNINMQICDLCSRNPNLAAEAVRLCKKKLKDKSPQTALFALHLLEALMKNTYYAIPCVHRKEYLSSLSRMAKSSKTKYSVKDKLLELLQSWGEGLQHSAKFPQFWMSYQALRTSNVRLPFPDSPTPYHPPNPPQRRRSSRAGYAQSRYPTMRTQMARAPHHVQRSMSTPEGKNSQSLRVRKAIPAIQTKFQLLSEMLSCIDPNQERVQDSDIIAELLPACRNLHKDVMGWIEQGKMHDSMLAKLLALNDEMNAINQAYNDLCAGKHPTTLTPPVVEKASSSSSSSSSTQQDTLVIDVGDEKKTSSKKKKRYERHGSDDLVIPILPPPPGQRTPPLADQNNTNNVSGGGDDMLFLNTQPTTTTTTTTNSFLQDLASIDISPSANQSKQSQPMNPLLFSQQQQSFSTQNSQNSQMSQTSQPFSTQNSQTQLQQQPFSTQNSQNSQTSQTSQTSQPFNLFDDKSTTSIPSTKQTTYNPFLSENPNQTNSNTFDWGDDDDDDDDFAALANRTTNNTSQTPFNPFA